MSATQAMSACGGDIRDANIPCSRSGRRVEPVDAVAESPPQFVIGDADQMIRPLMPSQMARDVLDLPRSFAHLVEAEHRTAAVDLVSRALEFLQIRRRSRLHERGEVAKAL